jgi:hypothetical protein
MIDTEYGTIVVSKKEYLYTKERVVQEQCPDDEIIVNGSLKQYSYWKEEVDVNEYAEETTVIGYKKIVQYGTIEKLVELSSFEQNLLNNRNDYREVIKLVDQFLKSH